MMGRGELGMDGYYAFYRIRKNRCIEGASELSNFPITIGSGSCSLR